MGSQASGFVISGGTFSLSSITTVNVIDNNAATDFVAGGNFSYLIGTAAAGTPVSVTNAGNFTFTGFGSNAPLSESLNVVTVGSTTEVFLNLSDPTSPFTWTGSSSTNWSNAGNWYGNVPPVSGNTAIFNTTSVSGYTISLNGVVPIGGIVFATGVGSYTFGAAVGNGDAFKFDAGASITVQSPVTSLQTFNAAIQALGALTISNSGTGGLTFKGNLTLAGGGTAGLLTFTGTNPASITTYAGVISSGSISGLLMSGSGNTVLAGMNTYTGATNIAEAP